MFTTSTSGEDLPLRDPLDFLRSRMDAMGLDDRGYVIADSTGTILWANGALCEYLRYSPSELVTDNVRILAPAPHRKKHPARMSSYRKGCASRVVGHDRVVPVVDKKGHASTVSLHVTEQVARALGPSVVPVPHPVSLLVSIPPSPFGIPCSCVHRATACAVFSGHDNQYWAPRLPKTFKGEAGWRWSYGHPRRSLYDVTLSGHSIRSRPSTFAQAAWRQRTAASSGDGNPESKYTSHRCRRHVNCGSHGTHMLYLDCQHDPVRLTEH